jgi:hypothetical protein
VPALLYRRLLAGRRDVAMAGLLKVTTLSIPVLGGAIGVDLALTTPQNQVARVGAGLVSVIALQIAARAPPQEGLSGVSGTLVSWRSRSL